MPSILALYTISHVAISLVAIFAGFVVLFGMIARRRLEGWTSLFLWATVATCVGGYFFPFHGVTPGHIIGVICLALMGLAFYARYVKRLARVWRLAYVISAVSALHLNFLVLIVQSFQKIPFLHSLAPTQSEAPFVASQVVALLAFLALGVAAAIRFREPAVQTASL